MALAAAKVASVVIQAGVEGAAHLAVDTEAAGVKMAMGAEAMAGL